MIECYRKSPKRELNLDKCKGNKEKKDIPVITNMDFGHTTPIFKFSIWGMYKFEIDKVLIKD